MTTDQSPPVSRAFMSRLREVLTARLPAGPGWVVWVDGVVEELAAGCGVEDPRLTQIRALCDQIDSDISLQGSRDEGLVATEDLRAVLDAVSVDATPAQGIDRSALAKLLDAFIPDEAFDYERLDALTTAVLALVRPVEGVVLRRCSWDECPGLEKSIPMHEQEDGPELHDLCENAMIAPEAVRELAGLYQRLAQERKSAS